MTLARRLTAELIGTALLLATIVGSGIMGEQLANGNAGIALLANSIATGAGLVAFILAFSSISAHFNPVVSLVAVLTKKLPRRELAPYIIAQIVGAVVGVVVAHLMFGKPAFFISHHVRAGLAQMFSEFIATFGLIIIILGCAKSRPTMIPFAVGAYITAAYWFTASTSFANPAVTLARALSDTFAGIRPSDVPAFIVAQLLGAITAFAVFGKMTD